MLEEPTPNPSWEGMLEEPTPNPDQEGKEKESFYNYEMLPGFLGEKPPPLGACQCMQKRKTKDFLDKGLICRDAWEHASLHITCPPYDLKLLWIHALTCSPTLRIGVRSEDFCSIGTYAFPRSGRSGRQCVSPVSISYLIKNARD